MPATIVATPGAADANSYITAEEANTYFENRIPLSPPWNTTADVVARAVITATRVIDSLSVARKRLVRPTSGDPYYVVGRKWTGSPSTTVQALAWPRTGMVDRNGNQIAVNAIPRELKDATAELAGQLQKSDRTLDSDVIVQGIKSVTAGSVAVTFKDNIDPVVISDMAINLLPPWWFTDETIEGAVTGFDFTVV